MDNFKKLLKLNKNKALAVAIATVMTSSLFVGCSSDRYGDPNYSEDEEEDYDDGFYNGGYHSSTRYIYKNKANSGSIDVTPDSTDTSTIHKNSSSSKKSPVVSKGKSGYSSSKGGSFSS